MAVAPLNFEDAAPQADDSIGYAIESIEAIMRAGDIDYSDAESIMRQIISGNIPQVRFGK